MKEFGSDFHTITSFRSHQNNLCRYYPDALYLSGGRMCLLALIVWNKWKRIWFPEYFCYDVIDYIRKYSGIEIMFYPDYPGCDDGAEINKIGFKEGDVLFRVNYFGTRGFRSEADIQVPVIEDHSHDLLGPWAKNSDADWCIASLRKTLPVAAGAILWTPKGYSLSGYLVGCTDENDGFATERWTAMDIKASFLSGEVSGKDVFRSLFLKTEMMFESGSISGLDSRSVQEISRFDIDAWYRRKRHNIKTMGCLIANSIQAENDLCNLFSFIILTENRQAARQALIEENVYPAVLWDVYGISSKEVKAFSGSMLSFHCDGRYSDDDMYVMASRIRDLI